MGVGEERELHMASKKLKDGTRVFRSKDGKKTGNFYDANNLSDIERSGRQSLRPILQWSNNVKMSAD